MGKKYGYCEPAGTDNYRGQINLSGSIMCRPKQMWCDFEDKQVDVWKYLPTSKGIYGKAIMRFN